MKTRIALGGIVAALVAGCVLASMGRQDDKVDLSSAREIWGDVLRDADQVGLQLTRMTVEEEVALGNELAATIPSWVQEDAKDSRYVAEVAAAMIPHLRRPAIPYHFHVIESPQVNAFALPGGHVFVLRGMMDFLQSEAELAAVIGHEMAHIDLRHCVERYQYGHALKRAGFGAIGNIIDDARGLITMGYSQFQELEADAAGVRFSVEAGYDPEAAKRAFTRLQTLSGEGTRRPADSPAGEFGQALGEALADYFRTHPTSAERVRRLDALTSGQDGFHGRAFYVGVANFTQRRARSEMQLPSEWRRY